MYWLDISTAPIGTEVIVKGYHTGTSMLKMGTSFHVVAKQICATQHGNLEWVMVTPEGVSRLANFDTVNFTHWANI